MLWNYLPDWQTPILERLEYKTDVLTNFNGSEQRIALRQVPRQYLEFTFCVIDSDKHRRELEAKIWSNGAKAWDVPMFQDTALSNADMSAGSKTIWVDTTFNHFAVGKKVFIYDPCSKHYQLAEIAALSDSSVTLKDKVSIEFPADSMVIPVATGYLDSSQQITRFRHDTIYDNIRFELTDPPQISPEIPEVTYRGYLVTITPSDWQQDLSCRGQNTVSRKWLCV